MFPLEYEIETVYYLENPEKGLITFATGAQIKYEDIIKDVFGVACLKDMPMMIQYNKSFKDSICKSHGVRENEITMEMVLRVASKMELLQLRQQYIDKNESGQLDNIPCPFDSIIRLQDGIYSWDQADFSYKKVNIS